MLSAKQSRIHGMKTEKWTTREKTLQYRGILKLHARDKKIQTINGEKLKKKLSRNLKELKTDIKEYRKIVKDVAYGDKKHLRIMLQREKDFKLVLQDSAPLEAYRIICEDYNLKRKQLDKLLCLKQKKRKEFCSLMSEYADLNDEIEMANESPPSELQQRQQHLIARYEVAIAKRHAAKSIFDTYRQMHTILKKDAIYYDGVLKALSGDQRDQCRVIYKTTLMGQVATENLDDLRQKYKKMAHDVWVNMKERETSLEDARKKADDLWEYAKSLVRIESDTNLAKKKDNVPVGEDAELERQINHLEQIFNKMKESMLIRSFEELFARLEDQMKQKERLSELYTRNLKERGYMLNKKKHAELMLQNLEHSMVSTTTKYKTEKTAMLTKIELEKKREADNQSMVENRGELLMNIRAAMQNMSSMLTCVKGAKGVWRTREGKKAAKETEEKVETKEEKQPKKIKDSSTCDDTPETEGIALLTQVARKAITLFGLTNFELDQEKATRARDAYENYICEHWSKFKFGDAEPEQSGMYFEHETVETSVLTRADIKMKSKQIVETNTKVDE